MVCPIMSLISRQMVPQHCAGFSTRQALTVAFLVACSRLFMASPLSIGYFVSESETPQAERGSGMAPPKRSGEAGEGGDLIRTWCVCLWWGGGVLSVINIPSFTCTYQYNLVLRHAQVHFGPFHGPSLEFQKSHSKREVNVIN